MKGIAEFDITLKDYCKNDDTVFGNWVGKCIMVVLGTMMVPFCMTDQFWGLIVMVYFAGYFCLQPKLYYSTEKGMVSIYSTLQYTPIKASEFIKDRVKILLSFMIKLIIAGEILGVLILLLDKGTSSDYVYFFLKSALVYIIAIGLNILSIYLSTKSRKR